MVVAANGLGPVSVKMRSGFEDTSRFEENLMAVQVWWAASWDGNENSQNTPGPQVRQTLTSVHPYCSQNSCSVVHLHRKPGPHL